MHLKREVVQTAVKIALGGIFEEKIKLLSIVLPA